MTSDRKINLLDFDRKAMEALFEARGHKAFQARNVLKWIHKHGHTGFTDMTDISKALRNELAGIADIRLPEIVFEQPSWDGTRKWVLQLEDGQRVETVFIPDGHRKTLCVSSQVGCALDCAFCATARQGFSRNLTVAEIIGQVWLAVREIGDSLSNVVMMGMGEPLANLDAVLAAMNLMQDDLAYGLSKYRVTVSTSGLVPGLQRLRDECDVSLAVSLHAPDNALRDQLVPINRKYPLEALIPACAEFIKGDKRRRITWEYVMLDGVNDSDAHAKALIRLLEGVPSKVNLIPFNTFAGTSYQPSPPERVEAFRHRLLRSGLVTTTRKKRGDDIDAACGQLVGKVHDRTRRANRRGAIAAFGGSR